MIRAVLLFLALASCVPGSEAGSARQAGQDEPVASVLPAHIGLAPEIDEAVQSVPIPDAYLRPEDQERARRRDPNDLPCSEYREEDGYSIVSSIPTDECFKMMPAKRWRGLWRDEFEGSRFCEAPAETCTYDTPGDRIWLTHADMGRGGLYEVEFIGRKTMYRAGYGHFGMSNHEIIVDRFILKKEIEAPPPPLSDAEIEERFERCKAAGNCFSWDDLDVGVSRPDP